MIKKLIRNIRQKPKGARDGVAFGIAMMFSLMVFTIWAFNTPARMAAIEQSYANNNKEGSGSSFGSLLGGIKDQFATAIESVKISTTTGETEESESTKKSTSTLIMPNVEVFIDNVNKQNSSQQESAFSSPKEVTSDNQESKASGREVRIITTQSTSSASSDKP